MDGTDDETFGSDEHGHGTYDRQCVLAKEHLNEELALMVLKWGGECRAELSLSAHLKESNNILVKGDFRLYEGTSENTKDLDGRRTFDFLVPADDSVDNYQRVNNDDEGGDWVEATTTASNMST